MKKTFISLLALTLIWSCGTSKNNATQTTTSSATTTQTSAVPNGPETYANTINSNELKEMLYVYASDEFEGRETGEPGQKKAVNYLKEQYETMGVKSPLKGGTYFQEVPLQKQKVAQAEVTVNNEAFKAFEDQIVLLINDDVDLNTNEVIYVGYGIDDDSYSDYKDIDVKGKVVLAKSGEPQTKDGKYVTTGTTDPSKWTGGRQAISSKRTAALENGAAVFIYIEDELFRRYAGYFKNQAESGAPGRLSLRDNSDGMLMLMGTANLGKTLFPEMMNDSSPQVVSTSVSISAKNDSENMSSENVLAFIEGSEKPDEIIVISAHLDHEGIKDGEVYNGADDDGSGTIALVEIAEAFRTAELNGEGPKRSILFLHVTGEEKGLLGSRYYTDIEPIFPLDNTVADLNIDMIGRVDPKREGDRNYIYLIGSDKLSTELHNISEKVNQQYTNITLDYTYNDENDPNRFYYRSDHYNFAKNNIPVIFYFNGTHDDYHRPSDTPDKIEYDLMENRARLVFYTAWELANRVDRIIVDKAVEP